MKLEVAITVDVEFNIAGAFADPLRRRPIGTESVDCPIGGRNAGLDFILDTLETHGLRGVFFVEALNTHYFGDEPMGGSRSEYVPAATMSNCTRIRAGRSLRTATGAIA